MKMETLKNIVVSMHILAHFPLCSFMLFAWLIESCDVVIPGVKIPTKPNALRR